METIDKIIASNIEARMAILDMDQVALAKATGLTRQTINRILSGKQKAIRPKNLDLIAEKLGTTRAALETRATSDSEGKLKSDLILKLYTLVPNLDDEQLRTMIQMAELFIQGLPLEGAVPISKRALTGKSS